MNKSRFVLALVFIGAMLITTVAVVSGGEVKVNVCHITGTHDFGDGQGEVPIGHVITIADPAYQSHLDHGDPEVWDTVTMPDGSEVCRPGEATKTVFVTSGAYPANLGGVEAYDDICMTLACNAALPGTYKAWMSGSGVGMSASDRLTHSSGPYILSHGGQVVAADWTSLTTSDYLDHQIDMDENGVISDGGTAGTNQVWTGTNCDGTASPYTCEDWTSNEEIIVGLSGYKTRKDHTWSAEDTNNCCKDYRLYCFQQ